MNFEGADIRPELVSILQKIWAKYGNVLEGCNVHSKDMLKSALKLLAKAVTILQTTSGRTVTKLQCDDVSSILMDLKSLNLRVEWLEPFVEKAMKLHRIKLIIRALEDVEKSIAETKEMKMKLSKELANSDQVVEEPQEDEALVYDRILIEGNVDLDQCIGKGLL